MTISRSLVAEGVGTAFLLATVVGSGIMAERLAEGNIALALLCNAIATGAILVVLITVFGSISGAHFNPAVTLAFALRGEIEKRKAVAYSIVQILGALIGTWVAHLMFDESLLQLSTTTRAGAGQWLSEGVATFGLVLAIFGTLRARPDAVPLIVGLYITAAYWFTASTSFANPAVTLARSITDSFSGILWTDAPGFVAAQLVGACLAFLLFRWLYSSSLNSTES